MSADGTTQRSQRGQDNLVWRSLRAIGRAFGFAVDRQDVYTDLKKSREVEAAHKKAEAAMEKLPAWMRDGHGIRGPQGGRGDGGGLLKEKAGQQEIIGAVGRGGDLQIAGDGNRRKSADVAQPQAMIACNVNGALGIFEGNGTFRLL